MLGKSHSDRRFKACVCKNKQSLSHFIYFLIFVHHQNQNLGWVKSDKVVDMLKRNTSIDNLSHCCSLSLLTSTECWLHQYSGNKYHKKYHLLVFQHMKDYIFQLSWDNSISTKFYFFCIPFAPLKHTFAYSMFMHMCVYAT